MEAQTYKKLGKEVLINPNIRGKYERTLMQKDAILEALRTRGLRVTAQRKLLIDIILGNECSCCKEIYYEANKEDSSIGIATVYRMVNMLEEIGAISRKNMYKIRCFEQCSMKNACAIVLDDGTSIQLSAKEWNAIIKIGLQKSGMITTQGIESIVIKQCDCKSDVCQFKEKE